MAERRLDPRAWLAWGAAASLPALLGRNPFPLAVTLIAVLGVRLAWRDAAPSLASWSSLVRLAVVFSIFGVLFNVLTVRSGDHALVTIPANVPLLHGALTLNALVFGLLSALAAVTLVLIGATLGAGLDWAALIRVLPPGLTTLAVAGSVAFTFLPQTARAYVEIKEAQAARGHHLRGVRDLAPLLTPLLTGGLERAMTLAESLESRGFGAPADPTRRGPFWPRAAAAVGLASGAAAGYLVAVARTSAALLAAAVALVCLAAVVRRARPASIVRTRYRELEWRRGDSIVAIASIAAVLVTMTTASLDGRALRYEPYPDFTAPAVGLPLLAALLLLLAPALLAPGQTRATR
jgi:energy-coupling factor transport system permease protein